MIFRIALKYCTFPLLYIIYTTKFAKFSLFPKILMDHQRRGRKFAKGKINGRFVECPSQKYTFYEALLECERGNLQVFKGNAPMSVQQAYNELCDDLNIYIVFADFKTKGFRLFESTRGQSQQLNITQDENIAKRLQKLLTAFKRKLVGSLAAYWNYYSSESIKKELEIIDQRAASDETDKETIQYDVYKPSSKFKKFSRGDPDFLLRVFTSSKELNYLHLADLVGPVPVKAAVVEGSSINYISLENFSVSDVAFLAK